MQELPEYKAIEDEDGRRAAFSKFVKRQKVCGLCPILDTHSPLF